MAWPHVREEGVLWDTRELTHKSHRFAALSPGEDSVGVNVPVKPPFLALEPNNHVFLASSTMVEDLVRLIGMILVECSVDYTFKAEKCKVRD